MRLPWGLRWWELAPEVVLGAVLAAFLATETAAATSALGSRKALTLMAGAALAWAVGRIVLVRFTPWPALRLAVFGAAAVAVAAVVVLPAYDDTTVVETLVASPATTTATTTPPAVAATGPEPAEPAAPPAAPAQPVALRSSAIAGIDHRASGTAVLYRQPDGTYVVGLEGIDIQPGPDYDRYVVPGAGREEPGGGVGLGDLRGNKGTQFYPVPLGTDVGAGEWTVLVWCEAFDVPIAAATLA
ncbi:MAG: DM13 domain-containing protein [Acidimicrobiia bacterium]